MLGVASRVVLSNVCTVQSVCTFIGRLDGSVGRPANWCSVSYPSGLAGCVMGKVKCGRSELFQGGYSMVNPPCHVVNR